MEPQDLIHDWNQLPGSFDFSQVRVELDDETLRDGLQNPSVKDPPLAHKRKLLHLMVDLGIQAADIGLPGAGPRAREAVLGLAREIVDNDLPISANCAARTVKADIAPIAEVSQATGLKMEVGAFLGSSPIRKYAEGWQSSMLRRATEEAVAFAVSEGLDVMYVTEDTTRSHPDTLRELYTTAIECGARRICLADTVGHATPHGVRELVRFAKQLVRDTGEDVKVDWHGHRDRGLGLANCIAAIEEGVDRVHATALGIGERCGNVEMDLLLVNMQLFGIHEGDLTKLPDYCGLAARMCGVSIPHSYPVVGEDAFRTGTGVHAAAIIKAIRKGDRWLEDRVYSGVPASQVGLRQKIEVSPVSGLSNVRYWLEEHGYDPQDEQLCAAVFDLAKRSDHTLSEAEIVEEIERVRAEAPTA
ncbi:MAG: 2-isopropylmalate synthase [Gemmatimonadota bacterium]|jgi:2-isopropylmalate synthase|nr:MAG: 2-isopropylmalate synthase [Gemmatimonadota bacterium]